jgi:hypothetical protein
MLIDFKKFDHKNSLNDQRILFKECFPECIDTPVISEDHYFWKFHSKRSNLFSQEFIASSTNNILGYYAAIPYTYNFKDRLLNVAMVCDVMTSVKTRGKGVFTKLGKYSTTEMSKNGFDLTSGFPIRDEVLPGHIKAGWQINFDLPLYGKFINFKTFLKKRKLSYLVPIFNFILNFYSKLLNILFISKNNNLFVECYSSDFLNNIKNLDDFYFNWSKEIPISLLKNNNFLNWRLGAPDKSYYFLTLNDGNNIVGTLIAREVLKEGIPCLGVLDICILKNYYKYSNMLISKLNKIVIENKLELILIMISKYWFDKYNLSKNAFIRTPFKFRFITKNLSNIINDHDLKNEENWHLMWIDSDDL